MAGRRPRGDLSSDGLLSRDDKALIAGAILFLAIVPLSLLVHNFGLTLMALLASALTGGVMLARRWARFRGARIVDSTGRLGWFRRRWSKAPELALRAGIGAALSLGLICLAGLFLVKGAALASGLSLAMAALFAVGTVVLFRQAGAEP